MVGSGAKVGTSVLEMALLSADRPAAHGKRRTYGSPRPDKGVPADPEGRALAARGLGPSPRARMRSGHWRRRRT